MKTENKPFLKACDIQTGETFVHCKSGAVLMRMEARSTKSEPDAPGWCAAVILIGSKTAGMENEGWKQRGIAVGVQACDDVRLAFVFPDETGVADA